LRRGDNFEGNIKKGRGRWPSPSISVL